VTTNLPSAFTPRDTASALVIATELSKSGMVPKDYIGKPGAVFAAMEMGQRLGLSAMQACQSIAVINGRPSLWGDGALGVVQSHPSFAGIDEDGPAAALAAKRGRCKLKRLVCGVVNECERTFSLDEAAKAGLAAKAGPWTQYPGRMLQMRARAFAMRDLFADALKGIAIAEDVSDYVDTTATVVDMMPTAKPAEDAPTVDAPPSDDIPFDADEPTLSPGESLVTVLSVDTKEGESNGKKWKKHGIKVRHSDGGEDVLGTFHDTPKTVAMSLIGKRAAVLVESEVVNGATRYNLKAIRGC